MKIFTQDNDKSLLDCLNTCAALFPYVSDFLTSHLEKISSLVKKGIESQSGEIKVSTVEVIGTLVSNLPAKEGKRYFKFAPQVIKLLNEMFFGTNGNIDHARDILGVVDDVVETDPKFFKPNFKELVNLMVKIKDLPTATGEDKDMSLDIVVNMAQRYPDVPQANKELLSKIVELTFNHILEVPESFGDNWENPPDAYDDEKEEEHINDIIDFATECIDRLCGSLDSKLMLKSLADRVTKFLESKEWKKTFGAFMALSQSSECIDDPAEIKFIVTKIKDFAKDKDPRVRYAVFYCLSQLSIDFSPELQESFHPELLAVLMQGLDDEVPRVVAGVCSSAYNFLGECDEEQLKPVFEGFFKKLMSIVASASSYVKENALSALSALSVGAPELFTPYYDNTMETLLKIFSETTAEPLKRFRGKVLECISIISRENGAHGFLKYSNQIFDALALIQQNGIKDCEDSLGKLIVLVYPTFIKLLEERFSAFVPKLVPSLLPILQMVTRKLPNKGTQLTKALLAEKQEEDEEENTDEENQFISCFSLISTLYQECPQAVAGYSKEFIDFIKLFLDYQQKDSIRGEAAEVLPEIIKSCSSGDQKLPTSEVTSLISSLWEVMDHEEDVEVLIRQLTSLQDVVLAAGPIFDEAQLQVQFKKCLDHLALSEKRLKQAEEELDDDEDELEVFQILEQDKDMENQFVCTLAEMLGKAFRNHISISKDINELLHKDYILTCTDEKQSNLKRKFGISLISSLIDSFKFELPETRLKEYYEMFKKFSQDKDIFFRHVAVFGIGSMAVVFGDKWIPYMQNSLEVLRKASLIQKAEEELDEVFSSTKENIVSSIAKIIKVTWEKNSVDYNKALLNKWLPTLPLEFDHIEAHFCHEFLMDLLDQHQSLVFNKNENIIMVLKIFTAIYEQESSNKKLDARIRQLFSRLKNDKELGQQFSKIKLNEEKNTMKNKILHDFEVEEAKSAQ